MSGRTIERVSAAGTAVFAVTAGLATAFPGAGGAALVVALGLFVAGSAAFLAALVAAGRRSRRDEIDLAGLFFLSGSAPARTRLVLLGSAAVEVAVAFGTAAVRPNTSVAFGILVPVYGFGLAALWAASCGTFPPRPAPPGRPPRPRSR